MCINCCINYIIINFKYNKNYKEEGDVMEIKKLILSLLFISLLSGCNLLESEVECNKNINSENFNSTETKNPENLTPKNYEDMTREEIINEFNSSNAAELAREGDITKPEKIEPMGESEGKLTQ